MGRKKSNDKYFTLMLVPHAEGKVYSTRFPGWLLYTLGLIFLFIVGASSFILSRHVDYELTKQSNIKLTEKNAYFVQELASTHEAFQRVAKIEDELRAMLQMKNRKRLLQFTGEGGPTLADQAKLMDTLKSHSTLTLKEFAESLDYLRNHAEVQMESYQELKKYIATQRSLMASRPNSWPVRGWVTSRFGVRSSPFLEGPALHQGVDIANEEGSSIKAPADGVVTYTGWQGSYGQLIVIDHGYGFSTRYAHLERSLLNIGQRVRRGQVIAFLGNTGRSTAPHLHYEIRVNGVPVNPLGYLTP